MLAETLTLASTVQPELLFDASGTSFALVRKLGQGSYGEVYLAKMKRAGGVEQQVALKLLKTGLDPRDQALERLQDEAHLLAALRHPVLLEVYDLVELDGRVALISEFVEGEDLSRCIVGVDRLPAGTLLRVIAAVASALDAAWQQLGVVHRDIKPANIRIDVDGNVKLLDFGIARSHAPDRVAKTTAYTLLGTMRYLAPERFDLSDEPQPSSDVFSLGCVLYKGLAGQNFFGAMNLPEIVELSESRADWDEFLNRRLAKIKSKPIVELLEAMLCYDADARPSASSVARWSQQIAVQSAAPSLKRWCEDRFNNPENFETVKISVKKEAKQGSTAFPEWMPKALVGTLLLGGMCVALSSLILLVGLSVGFHWSSRSPSPEAESSAMSETPMPWGPPDLVCDVSR